MSQSFLPLIASFPSILGQRSSVQSNGNELSAVCAWVSQVITPDIGLWLWASNCAQVLARTTTKSPLAKLASFLLQSADNMDFAGWFAPGFMSGLAMKRDVGQASTRLREEETYAPRQAGRWAHPCDMAWQWKSHRWLSHSSHPFNIKQPPRTMV